MPQALMWGEWWAEAASTWRMSRRSCSPSGSITKAPPGATRPTSLDLHPAPLRCRASSSSKRSGGLDAHIRNVAERFATAGYGALAPDLYSAGGARPPALAVDRVEAAQLSSTLFRRLSGWGCSATKPGGQRPYRHCPATRALRWVRHWVLSSAEGETNPFGTWVSCEQRFPTCGPTRPAEGGRSAR